MEYLRTDNNIVLLFVIGAILTYPLLVWFNHQIHDKSLVEIDLMNMGRYEASDLI